jgi:nucleoside-diphosphate-sugar epimerase
MKVLVLGGDGMAGHMIGHYLRERSDFEVDIFGRKDLEIDDRGG